MIGKREAAAAVVLLAVASAAPARIDPAKFEGASAEAVFTAAEEIHASAEQAGAGATARELWSDAAEFWRLYLKKTTDRTRAARATYRLGVCLRESGDEDGGLARFRAAREMDLPAEERVPLLTDLGHLLYSRFRRDGKPDDYDAARAAYREAARAAAPKGLPGEARLASAFVEREQFDKGGAAATAAARNVVGLLDGLGVDGHDDEIAFLRAEALDALEDRARAAKAYEQFRTKYPNHKLAPRAACAEGYCRLALGEFARAEALFRGTATADALLGLGEALFAQAKYADALKCFDECGKDRHFAQAGRARLRAAECLARQEKYAEAADRARPLIPAAPDDRARLLAADWYSRAGKFDAALDTLRAGRPAGAPLTAPERRIEQQSRLGQAEQLYQAEQVEAAAERFTALAAEVDDARLRAVAWHNAGNCWYRLRQWAKAADAYGRRLRLDDEGATATEAYFRQGLAYLELRDWAGSRQAVGRAVARAREVKDAAFVGTALLQAGAAAEKAGQFADAAAYYQQMAKDDDTPRERRADAHEGLARVALSRREYQEAGEQLLAAVPLRPEGEAARLRFLAGQCHEAAGRHDAALELYRQSSRGGPDEWAAKALLGVARCLETLVRRDEALDAWYDLATRYPGRPEGAEAARRLADDLGARFGPEPRR